MIRTGMTVGHGVLRMAAGLALLAMAAPALSQQSVIAVSRIVGEADLLRSDLVASLRASEAVQPGDEIRTGASGHLDLQLPPVGQVILGSSTRVLIHSIEAIKPPARMGLARIVVHSGTVQIDTRGNGDLPPSDIRLNVGALRIRALGAAAWIDRGNGADEVCLLRGVVELQGPSGAMRLDQIGSCVRATDSGVALLDPPAAGPLATRLAQTAFPGEAMATTATATATAERTAGSDDSDLAFGYAAPPEMQARATDRPASGAKPSAAKSTPAATPTVTESPRFTPYSSSATVSADGEVRLTPAAWTIVLASVPDPERARREAERLKKTGLDAQVIEAQGKGGSTWRVVSGAYPSKDKAQTDLGDIRKRSGLRGAWLTQLP